MSGDRYDPSATDEAPSSRGQYVTKKDMRTVAIGLVLLSVLLYPIFLYGIRQSEKVRCVANMAAVSNAIALYCVEKDDRYPPLYRANEDGSRSPGLGTSGLPYTWASDVFAYMNARHSFKCPSAKQPEITRTEHPSIARATLDLTYGMYAPYAAYPRGSITNPDEAILFGETSNHGSESSFNPEPLKDANGAVIPYDGFMIGWDTGNRQPTDATKFLTRLAYRETATGSFGKAEMQGEKRVWLGTPARHGDIINFITVSGQLIPLPSEAAIYREGAKVVDFWQSPLPLPDSDL